MKQESSEPRLDAAIAYFVNMAKGKAIPPQHNGTSGLGVARQATSYQVIPSVKVVTPTAQAVQSAKAAVRKPKVIRGKQQPPSKKRKREQIFMPGLDH